jgi:excisionase family DNA binding protein
MIAQSNKAIGRLEKVKCRCPISPIVEAANGKVDSNECLEIPRLLVTLEEAARVLSISRSQLYKLLNSGHLASVHVGRSRRIRMRDIENFVDRVSDEY